MSNPHPTPSGHTPLPFRPCEQSRGRWFVDGPEGHSRIMGDSFSQDRATRLAAALNIAYDLGVNSHEGLVGRVGELTKALEGIASLSNADGTSPETLWLRAKYDARAALGGGE